VRVNDPIVDANRTDSKQDTILTGDQVGAWAVSSRINILHQPVESVVLGLEYGFATRAREDGERGRLHRLQLAAKLVF
jgi:hypothetical protein